MGNHRTLQPRQLTMTVVVDIPELGQVGNDRESEGVQRDYEVALPMMPSWLPLEPRRKCRVLRPTGPIPPLTAQDHNVYPEHRDSRGLGLGLGLGLQGLDCWRLLSRVNKPPHSLLNPQRAEHGRR